MPYKAFVSSTFEDLKDHRSHTISALRKAGFSVDPMEDWTAATTEPKHFSQARVQGCDLCILLVAFRRGHVPEGEQLSITQLEYQAARGLDVDVLVFMLDEQAPWPRKFDELDKDPEIRRWRAELLERKGVSSFSFDPNSVEIGSALTRWLAEKGPPRAEGKLEISDIVVSPDEKAKTCLLDFRVHNTGKSDVLINRVSLLALSVQSVPTFGYLEFSKVYDLDISTLGRGERIEAPLSQVVKPGEVDRFGITLIARQMGTGVFRGWKLEPTLHTNFGDVSSDPIEVWLPEKLPDHMIQQEKEPQIERTKELEEEARLVHDELRAGKITKNEADKVLQEIENLLKKKAKFGF